MGNRKRLKMDDMKTPTPFPTSILATVTFLLFLTGCQDGSLSPEAGHPQSQEEKDRFYTPKKGQRLDGPAQFAEFHALIRTRDGEEAPAYEPGCRLKEFRKSIANRRGSPGSEPLPWKERGPGNIGGRTRAVWVKTAVSATLGCHSKRNPGRSNSNPVAMLFS